MNKLKAELEEVTKKSESADDRLKKSWAKASAAEVDCSLHP